MPNLAMVETLLSRDASTPSYECSGSVVAEVTHVAIANTASPRKTQGHQTLWIVVDSNRRQTRRKSGAPALVVSSMEAAIELLQYASRTLGELLSWESELKDALIDNAPLGDLVAVASRVIDTNFALIDKTLLVVANSYGYAEWISTLGYEAAAVDAQGTGALMDPEAAGALLSGANYDAAGKHHEPFYYNQPTPRDDPGIERPYYVINLFLEDAFAARLVAGPSGAPRRLSTGEEQLLNRFAPYLFSCYAHHIPTIAARREASAKAHELLEAVFAAPVSLDKSTLRQSFGAYGWTPDDIYIAACIQFPDEANSPAAAGYTARALEDCWHESCAVSLGGTVIWVLNMSASGLDDVKKLVEEVDEMLRSHSCRVGFSLPSLRLEHLHGYCRQALAALAYAMPNEGHMAYALFADCALDYMLEHACGEFDAHDLVHDGVLALQTYDQAHSTDYLHTVEVYLHCNCNATHAAEQLFIHRSTLLKRLDRIEALSGIDFKDADEMLHILISLKTIGASGVKSGS